MLEKLKSELDALIGKTVSYENKNVKIDRYKVVSGTNVIVYLDGRPKNFYIEEVEKFLKELKDPGTLEKKPFMPTLQQSLDENPTTAVINEPDTATTQSKTIKDSLIEMMELVKKDAVNIPQAKAMLDIANAIVNVQKTELQAIELRNRINNKR